MAASTRLVLLSVLCAFCAQPAAAQTGRNVLLLVNSSSPASEEIAEYYARKRGVPAEQVLRLDLPVAEEITREVYQRRIEDPVKSWLTVNAAQDRILYVVLTKDVPFRVTGTVGERGSVASVDSELTLVYRRLLGVVTPTAGPVPNPYFASGELPKAQPFSHRTHDLYLVGRLDGYTVADVKALIDRGSVPSREGAILLDARLELGQSIGNRWLSDAAVTLRKLDGWPKRVDLDMSATVLRDRENVLGHYSWGSNDRTTGTRRLGLTFVPGALAAEYVSTDARTFKEPPADWTVNDRPFGGSHQSLIGDLIRDGITGVAGHVAEPYLNATIRPDLLFPAYVSGFNLIEAFYLAMPSLSWQTIVIGDPLCAPFRTNAIADPELDPPVDAVSGLPGFLHGRRVAALVKAGVNPEAASWTAKAEVLTARGERADARAALERVTALDPAWVPGHLALAMAHEADADVDRAIEEYRKIVVLAPTDAMALNNLAWALATKKNNPTEALPFARRAYAAGKNNGAYTDTLAWVNHLLGQDADAEPLIAEAVKQAPNEADIHLHAAVILAARGKRGDAKLALDRALRLNPALTESAEVTALREQLQ